MICREKVVGAVMQVLRELLYYEVNWDDEKVYKKWIIQQEA